MNAKVLPPVTPIRPSPCLLRGHCLSSVAFSLPRCSRPVCTHAARVAASPLLLRTPPLAHLCPPHFALPLALCFQLNPATPAVFQTATAPLYIYNSVSVAAATTLPLQLLPPHAAAAAAASPTRCCCPHAAAATRLPPFPPFFYPSHSICARLLLLLYAAAVAPASPCPVCLFYAATACSHTPRCPPIKGWKEGRQNGRNGSRKTGGSKKKEGNT